MIFILLFSLGLQKAMSIKNSEEEFWAEVITLIKSSESKYKSGDFKGAIDDKRKIKQFKKENTNIIDLEKKFKLLIKELKVRNSKYDLIEDYKLRINELKKSEIIKSLEKTSEKKFKSGDYKGAINAIRRSEKYY